MCYHLLEKMQGKVAESVTPSHRMSEHRSVLRGGMAQKASTAL
jgi:hypothetical protein